VAVVLAGPYASLHLAPDRQPCQHLTTQFFTGRTLFLLSSQQRKSTEGKEYKVNEEQTAGKSFVISATDLLLLPVLLDLHALCAWFCSLL